MTVARGLACDDEGVRWAREVVEPSGNCTIRVLPQGDLAAALDLFTPLGVEGEGLRQSPGARSTPCESDRRR